MSVGYPSDYKNHAESCHKPIDDDQHIFSIFKSSGYTTAHMDDWAGTAFNSLNCVGFARNEFIDHTMKPFLLRFGVGLGGYKSAIISKNVQKGNKMDEILFPQLERFLDAYPDRPKFSLTWNTYLAHDNNNNLFQADAFFNDFFSRNKKKFDNSFIFFMGDHGIRWGDIRRTKIGEIEDSNPAFMVVLPEAIRQNSAIMGTIVQNSEQLVSHYDLFATFVDIAHAKHINGKEIVLHGSSILRPLPQPRTCDRLQIPIEFCTCMFPKSSKPKTTDAQSKLIASQLVENINEVIRTDKQLHSVCASLTLNLNASILVDEFEADNEYAIYFVTFNVNPGNGSYRAYAGRQKDGDITVLNMDDNLRALCSTILILTSSLFLVLQSRLIWIITKNKEFSSNLSYIIIAVCTVPDFPQNLAHLISGIHSFFPQFHGLYAVTTVLGSCAAGGFNAMVISQFALALNRLDVFKPKNWDFHHQIMSSISTLVMKLTLFLSPSYGVCYATCVIIFGHFTFDRATMSWFYDVTYPSAAFCSTFEFWLTMSVSVLTLITYFGVLYCMVIMKNVTTINKPQRISGAEVRLLACALVQFSIIVISNLSWYVPNIPPFVTNFIWAWTGGIGTIMHLAFNQRIRRHFFKETFLYVTFCPFKLSVIRCSLSNLLP
uniref:Sulfatase domain-containing protein n=2 Tax=Panagrellus redivivus TaxID=6233 RepID=A0A7E4WAN5_PANRE